MALVALLLSVPQLTLGSFVDLYFKHISTQLAEVQKTVSELEATGRFPKTPSEFLQFLESPVEIKKPNSVGTILFFNNPIILMNLPSAQKNWISTFVRDRINPLLNGTHSRRLSQVLHYYTIRRLFISYDYERRLLIEDPLERKKMRYVQAFLNSYLHDEYQNILENIRIETPAPSRSKSSNDSFFFRNSLLGYDTRLFLDIYPVKVDDSPHFAGLYHGLLADHADLHAHTVMLRDHYLQSILQVLLKNSLNIIFELRNENPPVIPYMTGLFHPLFAFIQFETNKDLSTKQSNPTAFAKFLPQKNLSKLSINSRYLLTKDYLLTGKGKASEEIRSITFHKEYTYETLMRALYPIFKYINDLATYEEAPAETHERFRFKESLSQHDKKVIEALILEIRKQPSSMNSLCNEALSAQSGPPKR